MPLDKTLPVGSAEEAKWVLARYDALKSERRRVEPELDAIAHYLNPRRRSFQGTQSPGDWVQRGIYNSYPIVFRDQLTSHLFSTAMNPANEWFALRTPDPDLNDFHAAKAWLDHATTVTLGLFSPRVSSFYSAAIPFLADDATFGTALQFDEFDEARGRIMDRTMPLDQSVIAVDEFGEIVEFARRFPMTGIQAVRKFGREALAPAIVSAADRGDEDAKFWVVLLVSENRNFMPGRMGRAGKPWQSIYVSEDSRTVVRAAGFQDNPFTGARWHVDTGEQWGRGQAWAAFAGVRLINVQEEAVTRAGQRAAKPALLVAHERVLPRGRAVNPGSVLYGGIAGGRAQVQEMAPGAGTIAITMEHQRAKIDEVREAFHVALFNLAGRSGLSPQEWFDQHAEMLRRVAPHITRLQEEYLVRKIEKRFNLALRLGLLPPPPPELQAQPLEIDYTSASSLAQRAADGAATVRFLQDLAPLAQLGRGAAGRIDARVDPDGVAEVLQAARGVPAKVLRSRAAADELSQRDAQAQQLAMAAELAPGAAGAAKDLVEARALAQDGAGGGTRP